MTTRSISQMGAGHTEPQLAGQPTPADKADFCAVDLISRPPCPGYPHG